MFFLPNRYSAKPRFGLVWWVQNVLPRSCGYNKVAYEKEASCLFGLVMGAFAKPPESRRMDCLIPNPNCGIWVQAVFPAHGGGVWELDPAVSC
jgi:hypothetical protein